MKTFNLIILLCCSLSARTTLAVQQTTNTEAQCARSVESILSALELTKQMNTDKQTLKGLSAADIRAIQKTQGNCAAQAAINKQVF